MLAGPASRRAGYRNRFLAVLGIVVCLLSLGLAVYPERRVLHGMEFLTDGHMSPAFANLAQDVLARLWRTGFASGVVECGTEVTDALSTYLSSPNCCPLVTELAAGAGLAPTMWVERLRTHQHFNGAGAKELRLVLTDLQPNPTAWLKLQAEHGFVGFEETSVDATAVRLSEVSAGDCSGGGGGLRSIHLALHHLPEQLVKAVFTDVVRTKSALLVADLAPTRGGVLWHWANLLLHVPPPSALLDNVRRMTWLEALALPLVVPLGMYDATVSVLRAYSVEQLSDILADIAGADDYQVRAFWSKSLGHWVGLPESLHVAGLSDPLMQYVIITPPTA